MEISGTTASPQPQTASGNGMISSDFQTFLRMMTTQLQNQDPLNPIDSSDYAVQLATFSGVEQQARTNQLLEGLRGDFGLVGMAQLAGWVGRNAQSSAPIFLADGSAQMISYGPASGADRAVLAVYDSTGTLVSRQDVPIAEEPFAWQPAGIDGAALPVGTYSLQLESYAGEDQLATTGVTHFAEVTEVRASATGVVLVLSGGVEVAASDITALRD